MPNAESEIELRKIEPGDRLAGLSLGQEFTALKIFLQKHARAYHEGSLARTYGAFDVPKGGKIVGYITLTCGEICTESGDAGLLADPEVTYTYKHYPALKIARLAVDTRYRAIGIGQALVELALGIANEFICPNVGCRFVVVDAKGSAVKFYESRGFTMLDTATNRNRDQPVMFMDLKKV